MTATQKKGPEAGSIRPRAKEVKLSGKATAAPILRSAPQGSKVPPPTPIAPDIDTIEHRVDAPLRKIAGATVKRYVMWRFEWRDDKWTKVPYQTDGKPARTNDPATWCTLAEAQMAYVLGDFAGIGIVLGKLTDTARLAGVDLDGTAAHVRNDNLHEIAPYIEQSAGGRGLHGLCIEAEARPGKKRDGVEIYNGGSGGRYFTLTGQAPPGEKLRRVAAGDFDPLRTLMGFPLTMDAVGDAAGYEFDDEPTGALTEKDLTAAERAVLANVREGKHARELFDNGTLRKDGVEETDLSKRDYGLALAICEAAQTTDPRIINRLMRASECYRPKWDEPRGKRSYLGLTIAKAIAKALKEGQVFTPIATNAGRREARTAANEVVIPESECAVSLTEDNIARVFAQRFREQLLFDHTSGRWLQWDGTRWKPEATRLAYHYTRELTRGLNAEGKAKWAKAAVYAAVETIARTDRAFACTLDQFDRDRWALGTPAGIVNLRTGQTRPPDPGALITRLAGAAPARGEPTRWLRFLDESTGGDAEAIKFLRLWAGYALTGVTTEQVLVFIYGPGLNGKGVFINVLSRVLGDYAQAADMRTFTASRHERHPTDLAALRGARLVTASETEQSAEWAESRIKQLTGGDVVRARFMRQDEFEYRPQFKLAIIGNHRPRLRDVGEAMRRRLRIVPFNRKPKVVNDKLEDELIAAEAGQILQWAISGCLDWQRDGLSMPPVVRAATDEYFESQDSFGEWLTTRVERVKLSECESAGALFNSWAAYCKACGDEPGTRVRFADELKRRDFRNDKSAKGVRVWRGLRVRPWDPDQ